MYCSAYCRHAISYEPVPLPEKKKCRWCKKPFQPFFERKQFCSDKCQQRQYTDARRPQYNARMRLVNYKARLITPWRPLVRSARLRALEKNVPFSLTHEWATARWTGRCELTGIEFKVGLRESGPKFFSPSIDRIEPVKGYVENNCRFVLWGINAFKHDATDADMFMVAEALMRKHSPVAEGTLALPG